VQQGFGERKLILVLDVYDIVKQVRKQSKVQKRLAHVDRKWEHPCDQALKQYSVCDHTEHLLKDIQYKMNATLLKSSLVVQKVSKVDPETNQVIEEKEPLDAATCALHSHYKPDTKPQVYSVSNHFIKATRS
jgi:hypothetical protein